MRCKAVYQSMQNSVTRNGTEKSTRNPWYIDTMAYSCPLDTVIMGSVVSMEVAPPALIGARRPKYLAMSGASSRVHISRVMLDSSAIVPSSAPCIGI